MKISTAGVIMHKPSGQWSQVLLTIFATLSGFLSAGRKQIAYHLSSVIHYLTHYRLLFFHWAVKRRDPSCRGSVCRLQFLSGAYSGRNAFETEA
jgi:hypothetical protein